MDPGPLNRVEYLKYVATFFNKETTANAQFTSIVNSYAATRQQAVTYKANFKGARGRRAKQARERVAWRRRHATRRSRAALCQALLSWRRPAAACPHAYME